jgi:thioredoxin reductase (NADPH)
MITVATFDGLELFAGIDAGVLAHVAARAADIHLAENEYLIHEGEVAAFFVLLTGRLEMTKRVGGMERRVGIREGAGDYIGEVPLLLEGPAVANVRALEPTRVARIEAGDFHTLLDHSAALRQRVIHSMTERVAGISELAMATQAQVVIVGCPWDAACHDVRDFLARNQIPFDFLEHGDPLVPQTVPKAMEIEARCPIVQLADGTLLVEPTLRELASRFDGLQTAPNSGEYDVTIVGAGPAGLAAAVYGASEGLRTLMIEREAPGGQAGTSSRIENYLGFPTGLSGDDLAHRALEQAKRFGAEVVVTRWVAAIEPGPAGFHAIVLDGGERLRSRTVILASGVAWRTLPVPGIDRLVGAGVFYGAARSEATVTQGQDIFLVGAGNSAGQAAVFFSNYAKRVTLLVRGNSLARSMSYYLVAQLGARDNVFVELESEVVGVHGELHLEAIDVRKATGETVTRSTPALFVLIGADAETEWLPAEVVRDENGYVLTGDDAAHAAANATAHWPLQRAPYLLETTLPGVFAAGDVRHGSIKRVAAGVGEGSMAIAFIHQFLVEAAPAGSRS